MAPTGSDLYVGLMSGTSLDGVDAALVDFSGGVLRLRGIHHLAYSDALRAEALALSSPGANEIDRAGTLANELARLYARAADELLRAASVAPLTVEAIGCHGQTVRHRPAAGFTVQLANAALLAELTGIRVVADFRSRDLAAGGQGAPLVPAFHAAYFRDRGVHRAVVNIGGIANVTDLPPHGPVRGFDTGPGNMLLDAWASKHLGERFDRGGAWAAGGTVQDALLEAMLGDPYFAAPPPKSTGRELFHAGWLGQFDVGRFPARDVQATLAELTAHTVAEALCRDCPGTTEIYVCGGGAQNDDLMRRLARGVAPARASTTAEIGIDPNCVEAMAFAWLARQALAGLAGNLPEVTGARGARVLGAIYPA